MRTELSYDNAIFWANRQYELLRQQAGLEVKISALEYDLDRREKEVLGDVTAEREDNKPRFSNELSRKAEVARRLELDPDYQRAQTELSALNKESLYLQREAKYAGKIVEIMCTFAQKGQEPMIPVPASLLSMLGRQDGHRDVIQIPNMQDMSVDDEDKVSAA